MYYNKYYMNDNQLNYSFPADVFKSGKENNNRIPITIIPNTPNIDRVNDKILLKAYDDECIKNFLLVGILDWDHKSILAKTEREKVEAWIGDPTNFYVDNEKKVPIIEGYLFKNNPIVRDAIYPALEAGSNRVSASLGGKILQKSSNYDPIAKKQINTISKLSLAHCAITFLNKAVHQDARVTLKKSCSGNGKCKESNKKCNDCNSEYTYQFDTYKSFIDFIEDDSQFIKTLEAGSETDISKIIGGQVLQKQSLEGNNKIINKKKLKSILPFILNSIFTGKVSGTYNDYKKYLTKNGLTDKEADEIIKLLAKNGAKIVRLTF